MLIMLDGVQGVGKSTILELLQRKLKVRILKRTPELNELLKKAPKDFAIPDEHIPLIRALLFQWKTTLDSIPDDQAHDIWILDRGPITTLAYQSMTLDYATRDPAHFEHYLKLSEKRNSTYKRKIDFYTKEAQLDSLFGRTQTCIHDFMVHAFKYSALNRHKKVVALHLTADPNVISTRFEERRNDVRANNMQDWFLTKQDEIDNYKRSYSLTKNWMSHEENFQTLEYVNTGSVEQGVDSIIYILKNIR